MRSFSFKANKKALDVLYRILTVLFSLLFALLGISLITRCVNQKYVYPLKYQEIVMENASRFELQPTLIFSLIKIESDFNPLAKSDAGAIGLMQIMPSTAEYIAKMLDKKEYDLHDETINIEFGCFYITYLIRRFESIETALCAYNAGEGNVAYWLNNTKYSEDGKTLKHIPFPETNEYIKKFNKTFSKYEKLYRNILDKRVNFE